MKRNALKQTWYFIVTIICMGSQQLCCEYNGGCDMERDGVSRKQPQYQPTQIDFVYVRQ